MRQQNVSSREKQDSFSSIDTTPEARARSLSSSASITSPSGTSTTLSTPTSSDSQLSVSSISPPSPVSPMKTLQSNYKKLYEKTTEVAGSESHNHKDLCNLLSLVIEALEENAITPQQAKEYVAILHQVMKSAESLPSTKTLRTLTLDEKKPVKCLLSNLSFETFIKETFDASQLMFRGKKGQLPRGCTLHCSIQLPEKWAGQARIEKKYIQVALRTLIGNAVKYAASCVTVAISVSENNNHLQIVIADDGCGINISKSDKNQQHPDGAGEGLSHCIRNVQDRHVRGDRISFDSGDIMRTSITMITTCAPPRPQRNRHHFQYNQAERKRTSAQGPVCVIADDTTASLRVLGRWLNQNLGAIVHTFSSGEAVLEFINTTNPTINILMTDQNMGDGIKGHELIQQVRSDAKRNGKVPPKCAIAGGDFASSEESDIPHFSKPYDFKKITLFVRSASPSAEESSVGNINEDETLSLLRSNPQPKQGSALCNCRVL